MYNIVSKIINDFIYQTPREILHLAFEAYVPNLYFTEKRRRSAYEVILEDVVKRRFLPDLNAEGGVTEKLLVQYLTPVTYSRENDTIYDFAYTIPPEVRGHRAIIAAHHAYFLNSTGHAGSSTGDIGSSGGNSPAMGISSSPSKMANGVNNTNKGGEVISTADVVVISTDTIVIRNLPGWFYFKTIDVTLGYNDDLSDISIRSSRYLSQALHLLIRNEIWTRLHVAIEQGKLHAGMELGVIRDYVTDCAGAMAEYNEIMNTKMKKVLAYNDKTTRRDMVRMRIGAYY